MRVDRNAYQFVQLNPSVDVMVTLDPDTKIPYQDGILRARRARSRAIKSIQDHNPFDFI